MKKNKQEKNNHQRRDLARAMIAAVMLFFFLSFLLLALKDGRWESYVLSLLVPVIIFAGTSVIPLLFPADKLLLALTNFLCALGVLVLCRLSPERYGLPQALNYGIGVCCMIICAMLVYWIPNWRFLTVLMAVGSLAVLALPLVIGSEINGAKNWIRIGSYSMQPSEAVKLSLLLCISYLLSQRKTLLCILFTGVCLGMLMLQKDLGTALLYYAVCLILLYTATSSWPLTLCGLAGGAEAAVAGYQLFAHVRTRVAVWLNPWVDKQGSGYQIVQSLIAIVNGGLWGTGLGLGNATIIPFYYNDFIFSVILHEFGLLFGLIVLAMYLLIVIRGIMIARRSRTVFHALLTTGCAAMIALQTLLIVGGNIKMIPLTGVTLPFISDGGTSMLASLCLIGFMQGVASRNEAGVRDDRALAMQGGDAL